MALSEATAATSVEMGELRRQLGVVTEDGRAVLAAALAKSEADGAAQVAGARAALRDFFHDLP